jgi:hypothetical protein
MILNAGGHSPTIGDYYYEDLVSILDAALEINTLNWDMDHTCHSSTSITPRMTHANPGQYSNISQLGLLCKSRVTWWTYYIVDSS